MSPPVLPSGGVSRVIALSVARAWHACAAVAVLSG